MRGKRQANHINNPSISTGGCREMEKAYLKEARKELMGGGALVKFHGLQGLKGIYQLRKRCVFPCSSTWNFHFQRMGSVPDWRAKILWASQPKN